MGTTRRDFIKGVTAAGALGVFAVGYSDTITRAAKGWWVGEKPKSPVYGNALPPEARIDPKTNKVIVNPDIEISNVVCQGCVTLCGVRVVKNKKTGKVLRVLGNPYHPLSANPTIPSSTSILDSYKAFSIKNQTFRGVMCSRGNSTFKKLYDPKRVTTVLKRNGSRGSGKWKPVPYEQAMKEIVEGGYLFKDLGENHYVEGLKEIRDTKTPVDKKAPEFGPRSNQLAIIGAFDDGRIALMKRFFKAYGTKNWTGHRGTCGLTMRAGYAALLDNWKKQPHLKPDYEHCEFGLFIGTSPGGNAGNPYKRQGQLLAQIRTDKNFKYVVVDPVQHVNDNLATGNSSKWIAIKPGTDAAFAMGIARWIFENKKYDENFLSRPNLKAAETAGEPAYSGATWLVITEPGHKKNGTYLRAKDLGLGDEKTYVVIDEKTKKPTAHSKSDKALLFYEGEVNIKGKPVKVRTSLSFYKESAFKYTIEEYSKICEVPVKTIKWVANEFTSHGKKAVVDVHGGTMHQAGFYAAYASVALNGLIGNLNWKGGSNVGGGRFKDATKGARYNLGKIPGAPKLKGAKVSREKFPYQKTTEFKKNGYPAKAPWYPFGAGLQGEMLLSSLTGYPYEIKSLIVWHANPVFGTAAIHPQIEGLLKDSTKVPLRIAVDAYFNETTQYCDYIFPDTVLYEQWGAAAPWQGVVQKVSSTRYPAIKPLTGKAPNGESMGMANFTIQLANALNLPGFGEKAIPKKGGGFYPIYEPADYYLRAFANIAYDKNIVPDASQEDLSLTGVKDFLNRYSDILKPEEVKKVGFVLARGGKYQNPGDVYHGEWLSNRYKKPMMFYQENMAKIKDSITGKPYIPYPAWFPVEYADGSLPEKHYPKSEWPFTIMTYKSILTGTMYPSRFLRRISQTSFIEIHPDDAKKLGIKNGEKVRLETPGRKVEGEVRYRYGLKKGVIAIEGGFGHTGFGAKNLEIGNKKLKGDKLISNGITYNSVMPLDPTIKNKNLAMPADFVTGAAARQVHPAKIVKI